MASRQVAVTLESLSLGFLNSCNEKKMSLFARVCAAACFKKLDEILDGVWAFSIAF